MLLDVGKILICSGLLLASQPAHASLCPGAQVTSGFGASFPQATTIKSFSYDTDLDAMYVTLPNVTYITYMNVPYSVAYQFSQTKTPDTMYAQQIAPRYKKALETNICLQLVTNNGKYLTVN